MKKKIISSLLAVAMMMSIAIPSVFAASSDVAGDAKAVNKITMKDGKDTYEIKVGEGNKVDFKDEISVYENETKLVLDHNHIRYMLNGNTGSGNTGDFRINGSEITAIKAGSNATLTIYDNYNASSKARVTVNLKSVPADGIVGYAESFTFKSSSYQAIFDSATGSSEGLEIVAKAHPNGTKFDFNDQKVKDAIADVENKISVALGYGATASSTVVGTKTAGSDVTKNVVMLTATGASGATATDSISIANVATAAVTYAPAAGTDVVLADLAAAINSAAGALYDAKVVNGYVELTAKTAGPVTAVTVTVTPDGTDPGTVAAMATTTTTGSAVTPSVITFNFAGVTPVVGSDFTVAGKTVKVGTNQALADVLVAFVATHGTIDTNWTVTNTATTLVLTNSAYVATIPTALTASNVTSVTAPAADVVEWVKQEDDTEIKFTVNKSFLNKTQKPIAAANTAVNSYNSYKILKTSDLVKFGNQVGNFNTSANLEIIDAIDAVSFSVPSNTEVVVGKVVKVPVTYYPPNANTNKHAEFSIASALNNSKAYQYAVINSDTNPTTVDNEVEILGVNSNDPAKAVLTGRVKGGQLSAWSTITVKPTNFNTDVPLTSKIDKTVAEVAVGSLVPVSISNLPANVTVKWTHKDDGTVALNKNNGNAVVIYGKKIGTNVVTATLSNGEKFDVAVTVKAATAPEKPAPGTGTDVPQTGDSLLANLF